jgi:hypothetical protein
MSSRNKAFVLALAIVGLAAAYPGPGEAKVPGVLHTAVVASLPGPEKQFEIAAALGDNPAQTKELQFSLQFLPKDVTLDSCAIRLVMAERYPKEEGNDQVSDPVVLGLFKSPLEKQPGKEPQPVAAWSVPPKTEARSAIILRSRSLCTALAPGQADPARFVLQTSVREGRVVLFGQSDEPSQAPRLLLTYTQPNALPGEADWSQLRRDAQHSGRSPWRIYDPGGAYAPTAVAVVPLNGAPGGEAKDRADLRQSPLLYGGEIFNALDAPGKTYQLVARDRSGRVISDVTTNESGQPIPLPKFIAAGGNDRLYYFSENRIVGYNIPSGSLARAPEPPLDLTGETLLPTSTPTLGADGSLYMATNNYVRAYSPAPQQKLLWRYSYPTTERQVGAVALSKDETTAYILLGGTNTLLAALDSATGDCRWRQQAPDFAIKREQNATGPMPIPVVAGYDILVTDDFPTGNKAGEKLYVFHDEAAKPPPAGGEVVGAGAAPTKLQAAISVGQQAATLASMAGIVAGKVLILDPGVPSSEETVTVTAVTATTFTANFVRAHQAEAVVQVNLSCGADKAPGGMDVRGTQDRSDHIPTPVAGPSDEAYYISAGKLCRSRNGETCEGVQCGGKDLSGITRLVGDNSAGDNFHHLYGLDDVKKELYYITFGNWPQGLKCEKFDPGASDPKAKLGPNLILAPGGTLYNVSDDKLIKAIVPTALAGASPLVLTDDLLSKNPDTAFRVSGKITTADNLTLEPDKNIILVAGESISFGKGFTVKQGAQLRARVGLGQ